MKTTGFDVFRSLLDRKYNVFILDSDKRARDYVLRLCPFIDGVKESIQKTCSWSTVIFHNEQALLKMPVSWGKQHLFPELESDVILIYAPELADYSVSWNDTLEDPLLAYSFISSNPVIDHILFLFEFPYERDDLINRCLPEFKGLPIGVSIGVLESYRHFGSTDLNPSKEEVMKTVNKFKRWFNIPVCKVDMRSVERCSYRSGIEFLSSFKNILQPSLHYRPLMGSSFQRVLQTAHQSLGQWGFIWSIFIDATKELNRSQPDEIIAAVSNCVNSFDKVQLSSLCPGWEDVARKSINEGNYEYLSNELKTYFNNTITKLLRKCERFSSPS